MYKRHSDNNVGVRYFAIVHKSDKISYDTRDDFDLPLRLSEAVHVLCKYVNASLHRLSICKYLNTAVNGKEVYLPIAKK